MHAVSISLGATSAIVSVATAQASSALNESQAAAPIKVTANSAGHRATPAMAAFAEHDELLFGEDARALFVRTPHVVVPYLFAFAALAGQRGGTGESIAAAAALRAGLEDAARRRYKGHCALVHEGPPEEDKDEKIKHEQEQEARHAHRRRWRRIGFRSPHEAEGDGSGTFLSAEEVLTQFFNHVKRHTIDGACGLTSSDNNSHNGPNGHASNDASPRPIVLTIVLPRYAFPAAMSSNSNSNSNSADDVRCALQWVRDAVLASHLSHVSAHISLLFRDEAALLAMDALRCAPAAPHPMAGRHFLLPATATATATTGATGGGGDSNGPWPQAYALVVDWGALGVSIARLRLEGGCLIAAASSQPQPSATATTTTATTTTATAFLRAHMWASGSNDNNDKAVPVPVGIAAQSCGGGDAVDVAFCERLAMNFAQLHRRSLGYQSLADFPARAQRRLLLAAEEGKITSSKAAQVPVEIEALAEGVDLRDAVTFSRARVDAALRGEWRMLDAFEKVLREFLDRLATSETGDVKEEKEKEKEKTNNGMDAGAMVDVVVLCGGMLQMPCIAQSLRQLFTRLATSTANDKRKDFSPNLVIMEAGACTTIHHANNGPQGKSSDPVVQTVGNSTTIGAEELASVGGCLHGYHLALTALQEGSPAVKQSTEKKKKIKVKSRRQREQEECAQRVWQALTRLDKDEDENSEESENNADELLVLQRPVLIYTATNGDALRAALEENEKSNEKDGGYVHDESKTKGLRLPRAALSELFAAHTLLPARVIVPIGKRGGGPIVLYLFTTAVRGTSDANNPTDATQEVFPLRESGVVLSLEDAIGNSDDAQPQDLCAVFSLQSRHKNAEDEDEDIDDAGKNAIELLVQLVRTAEKATESLVVSPSNVVQSITLDL